MKTSYSWPRQRPGFLRSSSFSLWKTGVWLFSLYIAINMGIWLLLKTIRVVDLGQLSQDALHSVEPPKIRVLAAYIEPINQSDWGKKPLPSRKTTSSPLPVRQYPDVSSCGRLTEQWPVDDPPTDEDPFLPWIHDVFPTADGRHVQFVAQNRRRCNSGKQYGDLKKFLQPNIALFQHVPLRRLKFDGTGKDSGTRYRLASHEDADPDGMETRFICRFQPTGEETLSTFNFNYDWHSKRKGYKHTFTEEGFDNHMIWSSQLLFRCPVPEGLVKIVRDGSSVIDDYATLYVDLIPVRTPPRYGYPNQFLPPKFNKPYTFMAEEEWGESHILPKVEDSGRWENIPICKPSLMTYVEDSHVARAAESNRILSGEGIVPAVYPQASQTETSAIDKRFNLVSCVWTSDSFHTRGEASHITDNTRRLKEWLEFHLMTGFDHIFVYDNSAAQDDGRGSLKPVTDLFPEQVTHIDWPSKVCNNRPGNGDNKGERSSQYAAESSCRLRFGAHSNWVGAFDIDEYIVPMGNHTNMKDVLANAYSRGLKILNFKSMRAWPRKDLLDDPSDPQVSNETTFLQTYNCDQEKAPRMNTLPAEKQIYLADYVLLHFVHYSTVTTLSILSQNETESRGLLWKERYHETSVDFPDELTEATMIHTKTVTAQDVRLWKSFCKTQTYFPIFNQMKKLDVRSGPNPCKIGIPFPVGKDHGNGLGPVLTDSEGYTCNCFPNPKVEHTFIPLLQDAISNRGRKYSLH